MFVYKEFKNTLRNLSAYRLHHIETVLKWADLETTESVTSSQAMCLWLADYLYSHGMINHDQVSCIFEYLGNQIEIAGTAIQNAEDSVLDDDGEPSSSAPPVWPAYQLSISDRRYCTVTGATVFVDLLTGKIVRGLEQPPIMVTCYDLCSLYLKNYARYNRQKTVSRERHKD